jgi:uncharacterized protein YkwD
MRGEPLRPARIAVACSLASLTLALPAPAEGSHANGLMLQKINQVRARHGLPSLRRSPSLGRSSGRFAHWLMAHDTFGHRTRVSASHRFHKVAEALAMHRGRKPGVRGTVRRWLRSRAHRSILLSRSRLWLGVGMSRGRFGRHRAVIWVLQTGKL